MGVAMVMPAATVRVAAFLVDQLQPSKAQLGILLAAARKRIEAAKEAPTFSDASSSGGERTPGGDLQDRLTTSLIQ